MRLSLRRGDLPDLFYYLFVRRPVGRILTDVEEAYAAFLIEYEEGRVSYTVVLGFVQYAIGGDDFSVAVGKYLVLCPCSLGHGPGE